MCAANAYGRVAKPPAQNCPIELWGARVDRVRHRCPQAFRIPTQPRFPQQHRDDSRRASMIAAPPQTNDLGTEQPASCHVQRVVIGTARRPSVTLKHLLGTPHPYDYSHLYSIGSNVHFRMSQSPRFVAGSLQEHAALVEAEKHRDAPHEEAAAASVPSSAKQPPSKSCFTFGKAARNTAEYLCSAATTLSTPPATIAPLNYSAVERHVPTLPIRPASHNCSNTVAAFINLHKASLDPGPGSHRLPRTFRRVF